MTPLLHFLRSLFAHLRATPEDTYLAEAVDLVDLEHRMAALEQRRRPIFGF
jgi:hypothetical protein